tara:strand:+ start:816 stop:1463 length:648 start_codon:yes stop_codon:yes gene_type:complete
MTIKYIKDDANMALTKYQATAFYDDLVRTLNAIEYPSVSMAREILVAMCCAWLRGRGVRVTPKNCSTLISTVVSCRLSEPNYATDDMDRVIRKALAYWLPEIEEQPPDNKQMMRRTGGSLRPMWDIEGFGHVLAVGAYGPFVLTRTYRTIVFDELGQMVRMINDMWDAVASIESRYASMELDVVNQSYADRVIRELESDFRDRLYGDAGSDESEI